MRQLGDLNTPERILLGPGPSMVPPRVLRAMAHPLLGHLDPLFIEIMKEIQTLLRHVFQTDGEMIFPISGTGSAGMEAAVANFLEQGDSILVGTNGYFSERLCEMASRYGASVHRLDVPWGDVFTPKEIGVALSKKRVKVVALIHAETSTGALQPMQDMARVVHDNGALLLMDCVTSLGGLPVEMDKWDVDIAYSGSQKCLSCPPGLAPFAVSRRAREVLQRRRARVPNWYLDLTMIGKYWGNEHSYHHTAPISMNFALREALRLVQEEGLEQRIARHLANCSVLWHGLEDMGLKLVVPKDHRLPTLTTVEIPQGVDDAGIRKRLIEEHNIEIGGALGASKGKVWRIGLMGYSSRRENVELLLSALGQVLRQH